MWKTTNRKYYFGHDDLFFLLVKFKLEGRKKNNKNQSKYLLIPLNVSISSSCVLYNIIIVLELLHRNILFIKKY